MYFYNDYLALVTKICIILFGFSCLLLLQFSYSVFGNHMCLTAESGFQCPFFHTGFVCISLLLFFTRRFSFGLPMETTSETRRLSEIRACFRDLNWTLKYWDDYFWPTFMWATIFGAVCTLPEILACSQNTIAKLSMSESLIPGKSIGFPC